MYSDGTAIRVSGLSKYYFVYTRPEDRLKQYLLPRLHRLAGKEQKTYYSEFKALHDVSFEVNKGEAVGIIGRNGAGKSTLLQLICGTLTPTNGSIEVAGTVAALLELGSGFNLDFTGRENVYLSASLLGLTRTEVDEKFDDIAAFADIGAYIEQPAKTFSSGMLMRLAFAVNTSVEPEILIVDEALSVGDAPFQSKCFKRLRSLIDGGATVLFVSHDISTIRTVCNRALWLNKGNAEMWGDAKEVCKHYEKFCWSEQGIVMNPSDIQEIKPLQSECIKEKHGSDFPASLFEVNPSFKKYSEQTRTGTGDVVINNFLLLNNEGYPATTCEYDEELKLYYLIQVCNPVNSDFVIGLRVRDLKGNYIYSFNDLESIQRIEAEPGELFVVSANVSFPLTHQEYVILTGVFGFKDGSAFSDGVYDFSKSIIWDVIEEAAYIKIHPHKFMPLVGPVNATYKLEITRLN